MIAFRLGKEYLEMDENASVSFTTNSPLTDPDNIGRIYSFDFNAPKTEGNDHRLAHAYHLNTAANADIPAVCELQTVPIDRGKLKILGVNNTYKLVFQGLSRYNTEILNTDLSEFINEEIDLYAHGTGNTGSFGYRIRATGIQDLPNIVEIKVKIGTKTFTADAWNVNRNGPPQLFTDLHTQIANHFNIIAVLHQNTQTISFTLPEHEEVTGIAHASVGFLFPEMAFRHSKIAEGILSIAAQDNAPVVFPPVYAPNLFPENNAYLKIINLNAAVPNRMSLNDLVSDDKTWANSIVPMVRVRYILQKIGEKLKLSLGGDFWENPTLQNLIIFNTVTLDAVIDASYNDPDHIYTLIERKINKWKEKIVIADHLPKMTAKAFLNALAQHCGIFYKVENGTLSLNRKKALIDKPIKDFTRELDPTTLQFELFDTEGVNINYDFDKDAAPMPDSFKKMVLNGEGKHAYKFDFDTIAMIKDVEQYHPRLPHYLGKINDLRPRFLILRGATTDLDANYYYASSDELDVHEIPIPNADSLAIQGDAGLYNKHLKGIAELIHSPTATAVFDLSPEQIAAHQRGDYAKISIATPDGSLKAIISSIKIKPTITKLGLAQVEMIRIR